MNLKNHVIIALLLVAVGAQSQTIRMQLFDVANTRKVWKGRALIIKKSNHNAGDIKLQVTSPGIADAEIDIKSIIKEK